MLLRDCWVCQWPGCNVLLREGRKHPHSAVVDHIHKAQDRPDLAFEPSNLRALCKAHHDGARKSEERRTQGPETDEDGWPIDQRYESTRSKSRPRLARSRWGYSIPHMIEPSAIPVVVVCGAPGAGKSTFVQQNAKDGDVVIDFDLIRQKVGGVKWDSNPHINNKAFKYRAKMLRGLKDRRQGTCWFIVTAPTEKERQTWMKALGPKARLHIMDTPKEECIRRIKADPERRDVAWRQVKVVERWFAENTTTRCGAH